MKYKNLKVSEKFVPVIGDVYLFQENERNNRCTYMHLIEDSQKTDGVVDLRFSQYGPVGFINTCSAQALNEFEAQVGTKIDRHSQDAYPIGDLIPHSFATMKSNYNWDRRRKFITKYLGINYCSKYIPMMIETVDTVLKEYPDNLQVNLDKIGTKAALGIICKIVFGGDIFEKIGLFNYTCPNTGEVSQMRLEEFYPTISTNVFYAYTNPKGILFPFLAKYKLVNPYKANAKNSLELNRVIEEYCINSSDENSVYKVMWNSGEFTREECLLDTLLLIFGGFDTISHSLTDILFLLKRNPEKLKKLMKELEDSKIHEIEKISKSEYASMINGGDYLMNVIREGLRMSPPTFDSLVYEIVEDTEICGVPLPKDTNIVINWSYSHYNPLTWHEPLGFIPERFDPESDYFFIPSKDGSKIARHPKAHIPFTFGLRNCPGQSLAKLEMKVILAMILTKIDFEIDQELLDNPYMKFDLTCKQHLTGKIVKHK